MTGEVPPRVFGILATHAPVVAVIRRGPTDWAHLHRWDLSTDTLEPGGWLHARVFPQRCDLSPDGRWFAYCTHRHAADWPGGEVYNAVSRLPWWSALAAWAAGTTYTQGLRFVADPEQNAVGAPDVGDIAPLLTRYGLAFRRPQQFAVEVDRGWTEAPDSPPREAGGPWDENRSVTVSRERPGEPRTTLHVTGRFAAFRDNRQLDSTATYWLETDGELLPLDAQWAEWDQQGRLLLATGDGRLRVHEPSSGSFGDQVTEHDLGSATPDPHPPPPEAAEW